MTFINSISMQEIRALIIGAWLVFSIFLIAKGFADWRRDIKRWGRN